MEKIAYITSDNFIDVDLPIIPLINKKYDVTWFVIFAKNRIVDYDEKYVKKFAEDNQIKYKLYSLSVRFSNIKIIKKWKEIINEIKNIEAEIIYIDLFGIPYFFIMACHILDPKRIVYAAHEIITHESINGKEKWARKIYMKFIFKKIQNFQVFSKNMEGILRINYPGKNYFYAPLALKNYGPQNKEEPNESCINFLFFGNIRKNKRLEYLIRAAENVYLKTNKRFKVTIAGNCLNWEEYSLIIKEHSIFDLIIRVIKNDEIVQLFSKAHYLVLPYRIVSQSGPLMVAFNYNIPTIASNISGFREYIIDGKTGYLFGSEDITSLESVMLKVIENHQEEYLRIKENLKQYIEKELSIKSIVDKYDCFFKQMIIDNHVN